MAVKILLVDEDPELRLALRKSLEKDRELEVVAEASPGSPVTALIKLAEPDVVLLDLQASPDAGLDLARLIREQFPELPIVAMGPSANGKLRAEASAAGAWAYSPKRRGDLVGTIRSVVGGLRRSYLDLSHEVTQRPAPESFVAVPDDLPPRPPPRRHPAVSVVPAPRSHAEAPPATSADRPVRRKAGKSATVIPDDRPTARKRSPARTLSDAPAWTSPGPDTVLEPKRKERRSRKKSVEVPVEISVRGPTGLPRRHGGHR